ncbi:MAG: hypothetical protein KBT06_01875 [Prevotellaceae bacterium]|nr:hypothetical protein [Candidatus Colivivens equi]
MNYIKHRLEKLTEVIDNGKFFREPMKLYYVMNGIAAFAVPAFFIKILTQLWSTLQYLNGWSKFMTELSLVLVLIWLIVLAYCALLYWLDRKKNLNKCVRIGDSIVAIPTIAHYIQCAGECFGIMLGLSVIGASFILYIFGLLSGFGLFGGADGFSGYLLFFLIATIVLLVIILTTFLVCYPIVVWSHVIGEKLRIKAQIANDVRDVSDIHRAATMTVEAENNVQ